MINKSLWLDNAKENKVKELKEDLIVDVLIIGGGMTGLSTAYHLKDSKLNICLVDRGLIAHGVSSRTTGKLTYLQENIYTKLQDKAKMYYESQKEAINLVKEIINKNNIDCDYEEVSSYVYTDQEEEINKIKKEEEILKKLNINYNISERIPFDINCKYAISVKDTAVFHPIKYLMQLKKIIIANNINIYENSLVTSIIKKDNIYVCNVNGKKIRANMVVIASHYPFFLYPFFTPLKTYLEKSYILASKVKKTNNFSAITVSKPVHSLRYHSDKENNYLIYLNGSHNLCNNYNNVNNFSKLIKEANKLDLEADYIWSNYDIMTEDNLPYIGFIEDNLLIGTGYNTWGMTNGSIAGKVLSDLILNKNNKYQKLFDPKRNKKLKNILKYPLYMFYSAKSFIENKIVKNKLWYKTNVKFIRKDGKSIGVYTDSNNKKHYVYNLCPHLKCSLVFNEVEKTWDCPCHGSRFDIDGKCIFGPSKENITYKEN